MGSFFVGAVILWVGWVVASELSEISRELGSMRRSIQDEIQDMKMRRLHE